jgi:hypothetical protein
MNAETGLRWLLRFIGVTTVPAMVAAVMPQSWFAYLIHTVDPDIPVGPLVTYLGRVLMVLFAFVGFQCVIFSFDTRRYRPLIWIVGVGSLTGGLIGLMTLFSTATSDQRAGFFWILVCDFGEGLLQGIVLVVLLVLTASRDVREGMKVMHSQHPEKP